MNENLLKHSAAIVDLIDQKFATVPIEEPGLSLANNYSDTHLMLSLVALSTFEPGDLRRLDSALRRINLWKRLKKFDEFDIWAISVAAIILRRSKIDHPIRETLRKLGRTFDFATHVPVGGNNLQMIQRMTEVVYQPVALGKFIDRKNVANLLKEIDAYCSPEGFYFDAPALKYIATQPIQYPPTYCLKFVFHLFLSYFFFPDAGLRKRAEAGICAILPLMARNGAFSYYGRSDNTTFAFGLNIFVLRAALCYRSADPKTLRDLLDAQIGTFLDVPETPEGYLSVNLAPYDARRPESRYACDSWAFPTVYTVAATCYVILSHLFASPPEESAGTQEPQRAESVSVACSHDCGLLRIRHPTCEVIVRTVGGGDYAPNLTRRYGGPTLLRVSTRDSLLVGAIGRRYSGDFDIQKPFNRILAKVARRFDPDVEKRDRENSAMGTGFIPVMVCRADRVMPVEMIDWRVDGNVFCAKYQLRLLQGRRFPDALFRTLRLIGATALGREMKRHRASAEKLDGAYLERRIAVTADTVTLDDHLRSSRPWNELRFSVRRTPAALVDVSGLSLRGSKTTWTSEGIGIIDEYTADRRKDGALKYGVRIQCRSD